MDLSSYWAFYQKYKTRGGQVFGLTIALLVGWQLGRIMSPYYVSAPIVFEDSACQQSGGSEQELVDLKEKGPVEDENKAAETKIAPARPVEPEVAGAVEKGKRKGEGKYVGSVNSNLFHDPSCSASRRIKKANQIWFDSVEAAKQAGYAPSKCTRGIMSGGGLSK